MKQIGLFDIVHIVWRSYKRNLGNENLFRDQWNRTGTSVWSKNDNSGLNSSWFPTDDAPCHTDNQAIKFL